jgi:hypothetical protein
VKTLYLIRQHLFWNFFFKCCSDALSGLKWRGWSVFWLLLNSAVSFRCFQLLTSLSREWFTPLWTHLQRNRTFKLFELFRAF